jgi:hypothetical protein
VTLDREVHKQMQLSPVPCLVTLNPVPWLVTLNLLCPGW